MKNMLILFAAAGLAFAAESASDAVKAAEASWAKATVADDEPSLNRVLADDLTYTHSTGETDTKQSYIGNLKSGVRKYLRLDPDATITVRIYGNTAVVNGSAHVETSANGKAGSPAHLKFVHVWVKKKGSWQLVAHQSLRLPN